MIEQKPISRRDFFKKGMRDFAVGIALIPKVSKLNKSEYHGVDTQLPYNELTDENGITVIDNNGIRIIRTDEFSFTEDEYDMDIAVDAVLLRENILSRAKTMLLPDLMPLFEKKLNTLVISFGARPFNDVEREFYSVYEDPACKPRGVERIYYNINDLISIPSDTSYGYFIASEPPIIYINTTNIFRELSDENFNIGNSLMRQTMDHEITHFIDSVNSSTLACKQKTINIMLRRSLIFSSLLGSAITMLNYTVTKTDKSMKNFTRREVLMKSIIGAVLPTMMAFLAFPGLNYIYFDDAEHTARTQASDNPTPQEEFDRMIKIKSNHVLDQEN